MSVTTEDIGEEAGGDGLSLGHLTESLQKAISWKLSDPGISISELMPLEGGSSRLTFSFMANSESGMDSKLVLRMDPPGVTRPGSLVTEANLMLAALDAGAPVPRVIMTSDDESILGAPFVIMEFVEGISNPRSILRDPALEKLRPNLAGMLGQALGKIHSIPLEAAPGLVQIDLVTQLRNQLDLLGEQRPVLELAMRVLEQTKPKTMGTTVVHGDFRNGNFIVANDGVRAIIDWELSHIGDPLEDLGWLCVRTWRFNGPGPVGGFGAYNQLIFAYEHASGRVFDRVLLRWWELACTLRWAVMSLMQAQAFLQGTHRSLDKALLGRRVCEVEWDILALLNSIKK